MLQMIEATRDRIPEWRALREELYPGVETEFHTREMDLILAADDAVCFLGVSTSGEVVALLELTLRNYVDGCLGSPVGYIEGIYIRPEWRGENRGLQLVDFAERFFRDRGCRDMAADSELANTAAQGFLTRAGFAETYRIVEYKKSLE